MLLISRENKTKQVAKALLTNFLNVVEVQKSSYHFFACSFISSDTWKAAPSNLKQNINI